MKGEGAELREERKGLAPNVCLRRFDCKLNEAMDEGEASLGVGRGGVAVEGDCAGASASCSQFDGDTLIYFLGLSFVISKLLRV